MSGDDRDEIRSALAEIRREQYKVAVIHAGLDATCVTLALALLVSVVALPVLAVEVLPSAFDSTAVPAPDLGTVLALLGGVAAFLAAFGVRVRRPAAEEFEAVNPEVAEALRTARDASREGRTDPMTRALYADVLDRLGDTSSVGLVNGTRIVATVVVAFALSLASVQTAVVGLDLAASPSGSGGVADSAGSDAAAFENRSTVTLQDGEEVLGEPTDVDAGSENLTASVGSSPGGEGDGARNYERDAGGGDGDSAEAERAGFASPERVEDADLVRRYAQELEANDTDV